MDPTRFDSLSRELTRARSRRGVVATLVVGALELLGRSETTAKHKHKRKKKHPSPPAPPGCVPSCSGQTCGPDGCGGTCACAAPAVCDAPGSQCCDPEGTICSSFATCCSQACDFKVRGGTCASCRGQFCDARTPCCTSVSCTNNRCGGCVPRATLCNGSLPCCASDCSGGFCLSNQGGRCVYDADCRTCNNDLNNCMNACVNGACVR
jgi:hypothetical protein